MLTEYSRQKALKIIPKLGKVLFNRKITKVPIGNEGDTAPIMNLSNGKVRGVHIGEFLFLTQNPLKDSVWALMARKGRKITWCIHTPSKKWVARSIDGEANLLL